VFRVLARRHAHTQKHAADRRFAGRAAAAAAGAALPRTPGGARQRSQRTFRFCAFRGLAACWSKVTNSTSVVP